MATVVFDIETVGGSWDALDDGQRTYLQKYVRNDEDRAKLPEMMSLWPLTGKIVVLAMLNPDSGRGRVWYEKNDGRIEETSADSLFTFVGDTEPAFLAEFWSAIARFDRFVSFNGRCFDGPFLMLRSAALGLRVSKNLCDYRYAIKPHTDLLDVLSFFGASRKWNLDFACKAFGVESPKENGLDGYAVGHFYRENRLREIAFIAGATSRRRQGSSRSSRKPSFRRWKTRDSEATRAPLLFLRDRFRSKNSRGKVG